MLVCTIYKPLVDFGEDHDDLALLLIEDDIIVEHLLVELQDGQLIKAMVEDRKCDLTWVMTCDALHPSATKSVTTLETSL